jgi:hypothetical protein
MGRIPHPNSGLLSLALKSMWDLNQNMVYLIFLSMGMVLLAENRMRSVMIPVLLWILAWFFYYAYIYNYPNVGGDYLSGLRYMLPVVLVLFWAAGSVYQEMIDALKKNNSGMATVLQCGSVVFLVLMVFFRKAITPG